MNISDSELVNLIGEKGEKKLPVTKELLRRLLDLVNIDEIEKASLLLSSIASLVNSKFPNKRKRALSTLGSIGVGLYPYFSSSGQLLKIILEQVLENISDLDTKVRAHSLTILHELISSAPFEILFTQFEVMFGSICISSSDRDITVRKASNIADQTLLKKVTEVLENEQNFFSSIFDVIHRVLSTNSLEARIFAIHWIEILRGRFPEGTKKFSDTFLEGIITSIDLLTWRGKRSPSGSSIEANEFRKVQKLLGMILKNDRIGLEDHAMLTLFKYAKHPNAFVAEISLKWLHKLFNKWQGDVKMDLGGLLKNYFIIFNSLVVRQSLPKRPEGDSITDSVSFLRKDITSFLRSIRDRGNHQWLGFRRALFYIGIASVSRQFLVRKEALWWLNKLLELFGESVCWEGPEVIAGFARLFLIALQDPREENALLASNHLSSRLIRIACQASKKDLLLRSIFSEIISVFGSADENELSRLSSLFFSRLVGERPKNWTLQGLDYPAILRSLATSIIEARKTNNEGIHELGRRLIRISINMLFVSSNTEYSETSLSALKEAYFNYEPGNLFDLIFRAGVNSPVSLVALCLGIGAFPLAYSVLEDLGSMDLKDSRDLVLLLESPQFTELRLKMLKPTQNPFLCRTMMAILLLVSEREDFEGLERRLEILEDIELLQENERLIGSLRDN